MPPLNYRLIFLPQVTVALLVVLLLVTSETPFLAQTSHAATLNHPATAVDPSVKLPPDHPAARPALLCFGDSITARGAWVDAVDAAGPWRLINAGRSGRKTSDLATEFPPALAAHPEAAGVLILLGVNDLPARDPRPANAKVASCLANLQGAVDLALTRFPAHAIFLAAPPNVDVNGMDSVNRTKGYDITPPILAQLAAGIEQLVRTTGVQFFSLYDALRPGHFSDGLHPNAEGDAALERVIGRALSRPAFYVVGDSISIDYHDALAQAVRGHYRYVRKGGLELARTDLDHPQGANGGDSAAVLAHVREALQNPAALPATILVNCGLHDLKTDPATGARQVSLDAYRVNLATLADLVHAAGKRLVWITTTPLDEQRHNARSRAFHRFERDLLAYNAAAREVMEARSVPVIDLHAFTAALEGPLFRDHVHFVPAVSERQASFIRESLDALPWPVEP